MARPGCILESSFKVDYTEAGGLGQPVCRWAACWWQGCREASNGRVGRGVFMAPIDRELLSSSVISEEQMSLPATAYTDDSVLEWKLEHFFDESWVCVGRSGDLHGPGDRCAVALGRESA